MPCRSLILRTDHDPDNINVMRFAFMLPSYTFPSSKRVRKDHPKVFKLITLYFIHIFFPEYFYVHHTFSYHNLMVFMGAVLKGNIKFHQSMRYAIRGF